MTIFFVHARERFWVGLVILTTNLIAMWAAYLYGREISNTDQVLLAGLAPNGIAVVMLALTATIGIFAGPPAMRRCWADGQKISATLIGFVWFVACSACAAGVILMNPLDLPMSSLDSRLTIVGLAIYVLLMSVLPTAVIGLPGAPTESERGARTSARNAGTSAVGSATERLWRILEDLSRRGPGPAGPKTTILGDGTIATSQGALADLADTSKGAINRGLNALKQDGRIDLETSMQETRITLLTPRAAASCQHHGTGPETPIGTYENAMQQPERVVTGRS